MILVSCQATAVRVPPAAQEDAHSTEALKAVGAQVRVQNLKRCGEAPLVEMATCAVVFGDGRKQEPVICAWPSNHRLCFVGIIHGPGEFSETPLVQETENER